MSRLDRRNIQRTLHSPRVGLGDTGESIATQDGTGATVRPSWYEVGENAKRQADFYLAYADSLLADSASDDTEEPDNEARWVRSVYPPEQWTRQATVANALQTASEYATLVNDRWATRLAVRAAKAYIAAGLPYGLFLLTAMVDERTLQDSTADADLIAPFQTLGQESSQAEAALRHPVQQTYLVLAAASRPQLADDLSQTLAGARDRLRSFSFRPVGSQGVPIGDYLDIADGMTREGISDEKRIEYLALRLAALNRNHAASLRTAQRNRYLWRTSAAVDLETAALSGLTLRYRPDQQWFNAMSTAITLEVTRDDLLAELPVWTMGELNHGLSQIRPEIMTILREPDQPSPPGGYRDSYGSDPEWEEQAGQTRRYGAQGDRPDEYWSAPEPTWSLPDEGFGEVDGGPEPGGTDGEAR